MFRNFSVVLILVFLAINVGALAQPTVISVTSSTSDGTFKIGDGLSVEINFSNPVTVTGTPRLLLETGTIDRNINYAGGSGTTTLLFSYTVQTGDVSSQLNYESTSALTLNGGTIQDGTLADADLTLPGLAATESLAGTTNFSIDGVVPTVTSVTVPSNGSYNSGQDLDFTINFSENVTVNTVGGTPQMSLTVGSTVRQAVYQSGSGTSALLFSYTVQSGELDANGIVVGTLSANGGTIKDAATNNATLTLSGVGSTTAVLVDAVAPTVSSVTSNFADGFYRVGQTITIRVLFSENVTVSGTPQLTLETGTTDRVASYASGSGTIALTFTYTVQAGDESDDLDYTNTSALALNSGIIQDGASNNAVLTLATPGAAGSLGGNKDFVIDGIVPTVTSVTVPSNGTYSIGQNLDFTVNFSENVTVNTTGGTPRINLTVGVTARQATYQSGSGTSALLFSYTVQAGELDANGIVVGTLSANGGTIKDAATNNATLTLNGVGSTTDVLVDAVAPTVSSVSSSTANGLYGVGQTISITVLFSENVTVSGTPQLTLETGTTDRVASYSSGSGTSTLTFTYTVQAGDGSADLDYTNPSALALNSGTIQDVALNDAALTLATPGAAGSLGVNKNIVIDGVAPTVTSVTVPSNGTYIGGQDMDFTINFSENVTVTTGGGTPQMSLTIGATARQAIYQSGSGTGALLFRYTVQAGELDANGIVVGTLSANGGTIKDATTNNATLTLNGVGSTTAVLVDAVIPTVNSVTVPSNGTYIAGQDLDFTINFSENVIVNTTGGTPQMSLTIGATVRQAVYQSGSGTSALLFSYTVLAGELDTNGIVVGTLSANGGTIRDAATNNATLTLNIIGSTTAVLVDAAVPTITSVTVPSNGTFIAGQDLDFTINFSENVTVNTGGGTPQMSLIVGAAVRQAVYQSGSGTSALLFSYTIQAGELDANGIVVGTLSANGGTIKDAATNNATLTLNGVGSTAAVLVDAVAPTVSSVSSSTANGLYGVGQTINITILFSENVTVSGTPQLTLETGTTDRVASYSSGSGTSTLTFTYTVQAGDGSADLDYTNTSALALNSGTIQDGASNNAVLTLATPGAAGSLGANKNISIDSVVPSVTSVTVPANGTYIAGQDLDFTINFSENITVTTGGGTPQMSLTVGAAVRQAVYQSGSGTSALLFSYTVQSGELDVNGIVVGTLSANGGTVKDAATNNATLTLNGVGSTTAVLVDAAAPTVTSVTVPSNGTYIAVQDLDFTINFSENVTVTTGGGTPQMSLTIGVTVRQAVYQSGSGTGTLLFRYTVQAGELDANGIAVGTLSANGGTIRDAATNNATLTLTGVGSTTAVLVDAVVPNVNSVSSPETNSTYGAGQAIDITILFSENVTVTGTPQLTLETGTTDRIANYSNGSGTSTLTFTYTVQAGDVSADLDYTSTSALALNSGSIQDGASNNATLTLTTPGTAGSLSANKNIIIDGVVPVVSSVSSSTANGSYGVGQAINITILFSENVSVTGTPQLTLETGTTDRIANYSSGSGTNTLSFTYTVQTGDVSADLAYTSTSALTLNSGTIQDGALNNAVLTLPTPGTAGSLSANKNIIIDGVIPVVSSVSSSTANGSYGIGQAINITVLFSENVTVTGTPQLTLETGTTDRIANYSSGSGTSTLTFTYTVQTGDASADLDYTSTSAFSLNSGTIQDGASNNATLTLASPGAVNSLGSNKSIIIDGIVPTVSSVSSSTANGSYGVGQTINITVLFSENVTVTGTPQLTLETGTTNRIVNYSSGSGTSTLIFAYTVQSGDVSGDLDYISTSALALNSGTINDGVGNAATLTLVSPGAAGSLGASKNIVIDGIAPTVSSVSSSTANGSHGVGQVISITALFSENVTVTGIPQLTLETGTTDRIANYSSGSGTSTLTFTYTVQASDVAADLDYTSTSSLALNSGTIQDGASNNAVLTLAIPGTVGSLGDNKNIVIDGVAPTVSSVSSSTANGSYGVGQAVNITVLFSENVIVTGTPQLTLETGTTDRIANYSSGSGTSTLTFIYTVQTSDVSADLDYTNTTALALNAGTIQDGASNNAVLTLATPGGAGSLGASKNIVIDGVAPTVSSVSSSTANGSYGIGQVINITVLFSETVTVTGTPQLTLETGTTNRIVNYSSGSGTSTLIFAYTVQSGDVSADLDYVSTSALALNSGAVNDGAGNAATLTLVSPGAAGSLGASKSIVIDGVVPVVNSVSSSTVNDSYGVGQVISITVLFSENVTVTGTPQLTVETGTTDRVANYSSGSGTSTLTFTYTVQSGDVSADLDYVNTTALILNAGTIQDGASNNATLTLAIPGAAGSLGASKNIVIDGVAPTVSSVSSSTANGSHGVGQVISITLLFSENVTVTGTPQLTLETGVTDHIASYSSGSGTSTLTFTYTVQTGDVSADLDYTNTTALTLNGGIIQDDALNNATLTLATPGAVNSLGANKSIVIDGIVPTVSSVSSSTANGSYGVGQVINITVLFSETVTVTGTPQLTLETGVTDHIASYSSGSGTNTLTFTYTVQTGDVSPDLDYTSTSALALNSGTIQDGALNNAVLTLATPGAAGSLGANKIIVIDGVAPTVSSVSSSTANGSYGIGQVINITVLFSETVTVTGTPQLTLETGSTDRIANYSSGSGTSTLTFTYTVQTGDVSADLDYTNTTALALNGGTIQDGALNNATLTLATPGAVNSLGANKSIVIDGIVPTVSSVSSSTANGSYGVGQVINITVLFSESVTVTGTPQLTLETGTTDRVVNYSSGSGTSTLTFAYTVQTGDVSADLDYINTTALILNGGTIQDGALNNATLTLATPGAVNSLGANKSIVIDGIVPTVSSVSSSTANGSYGAGQVINITVLFSESVTVTGTPQLTLETGTTDRIASYSTGSGTNTLTFTYTVQTGDVSADLDYSSISALVLNGGTVIDGVGNPATLTLPAPGAAGSLGANKNIVIDGIAPTVSSVSSTTADGPYKVGQVIDITILFSESVTVTGTPQLALETGTIDRIASYSTGSGTSTLTFTYTIQTGDASADLDYSSISALALNGGTVIDGVGNPATLTLPTPGASGSLGANKNIVIDGIAPVVTAVSSTAPDGLYGAGQIISISVIFPENVVVTGTPQITLETGAVDRIANYSSGSGTSTLIFDYTVQPGDFSSDLDYINSAALSLNGGTIKDIAGNSAAITLPVPGTGGSLGVNKNIAVDGSLPAVTSVSSTNVDGTYATGQTIAITALFSENVTVTGTPQLTLETGTTDRIANYSSGSGTSTLTFIYTVQFGDESADLDYLNITALALNGGTIRDPSSNAAILTLPAPGTTGSLGVNKNIIIDAILGITSFNPSSGLIGTTVTISGKNFSAVTAENSVKFNGMSAVVIASTTTTITTSVPAGATTGLIEVTVSGVTATSITNFIIDPTAPSIDANNTPAEIETGTSLLISAKFSDEESGVINASVIYRSVTGGPTTTTTQLVLNNDNWEFTIPSTEIGELGIEYKLQATNGSELSFLSTSFMLVKIKTPNGLSVPYSNFGSDISSYEIFSISLDLDNTTVSKVFDELPAHDKSKWRISQYDNATDTNIDLNATDQLEAGKGYWLIVRNDPGVPILTGSGKSMNVNPPFSVELKQGWNQIGNPYNFDLVWSDLVTMNPGLPTSFRTYNGSIKNFEDADNLPVMRGGFVFVNSPMTLNYPVKKNTGGRIRSNRLTNPLDASDWEVNFSLKQKEISNVIGGIGMRTDASEEFDLYDGFSMPRFETFLDLNHNKKLNQYAYSKDIVPSKASQTWSFSVDASAQNQTSISWDNSYFGSNPMNLILVDETSHIWIDMKQSNSFSFTPPRNFKVIYGDNNFVDQELNEPVAKILSVSPNPSRGLTKLGVFIPAWQEELPVQVELISLMGQTVGEIFSGKLTSGYQILEWQGTTFAGSRPVPGVYIIKMQCKGTVSTVRVVLE